MVLKEFRPLVSAVGEPSAGRCLHFGNDLDYSTHQEQSQGYTPWQRRAPSKNAVILVPGEEGRVVHFRSHMLEAVVRTGWRRLHEVSQGDGSGAESGLQLYFL